MKNRLHCFIRRRLLLLLLCCAFFSKTFSQNFIFGNGDTKIEAGVNFGPTFFLGDLGGHAGYGTTFLKDLNLQVTKAMKGMFFSIYPNDYIGFLLGADITELDGADSLISTNGVNELWRKQRNLDFKTNVWEVYSTVNIYPVMWLNRNNPDYKPKFRPYGFVGVGVFHFNPMGSLTQNGVTTWYYLRPLHTEGEGFPGIDSYTGKPFPKEYNLTQMNIPIGCGMEYYASDRVTLSLEFYYRKTFTDYIDDVSTIYIDPSLFYKYLPPQTAQLAAELANKSYNNSSVDRLTPGMQRGDPSNDDTYFSFLLKIGFRLGPIFNSEFDRDAAERTKCPTRF